MISVLVCSVKSFKCWATYSGAPLHKIPTNYSLFFRFIDWNVAARLSQNIIQIYKHVREMNICRKGILYSRTVNLCFEYVHCKYIPGKLFLRLLSVCPIKIIFWFSDINVYIVRVFRIFNLQISLFWMFKKIVGILYVLTYTHTL